MCWTRGFYLPKIRASVAGDSAVFPWGGSGIPELLPDGTEALAEKKTRERLNQMLKRINDALPELILGILIYEIVVEFTGIWFVKDKLGYSNGLLIGAATAIGMAIHMAVVLRDSMDMAESGRTRRIALQYVLRYLVVVAVFFATAYFEIGNVIVAFVGVMGLKVGAYVQPFTHKVILKLLGRGDESS